MNFSEEREVAGQDHAFLREVDLGVKFVDRHPILKVPVQPVGLLDQDGPNPRIGPQKRDHLGEAGAARLLRRFNINVFLDGRQPFAYGVLLQQLELRRDREPFLFLFL